MEALKVMESDDDCGSDHHGNEEEGHATNTDKNVIHRCHPQDMPSYDIINMNTTSYSSSDKENRIPHKSTQSDDDI